MSLNTYIDAVRAASPGIDAADAAEVLTNVSEELRRDGHYDAADLIAREAVTGRPAASDQPSLFG